MIGKCCLYGLWIATPPSIQQVTSKSPVGEYANFYSGLLNWVNSSATQVLSISNTLIVPDSNPQENNGKYGWAATVSG